MLYLSLAKPSTNIDLSAPVEKWFYIKVNDPNLNRNVGKIDIPDVYKVLRDRGGATNENS